MPLFIFLILTVFSSKCHVNSMDCFTFITIVIYIITSWKIISWWVCVGVSWSFFGTSTGIPTYPHTYSATNYFSGSNYVYDDCDECEAIHTIYMTFGTKNC